MISISDLKTKITSSENEYIEARICQEILLLLLSKSKYKNHFTIKGGVLMRNISNDERRTTLDIDVDFIKYPITDKGVRSFINELNGIDGIKAKILGKVEELKHQDYRGKRINVKISDSYGDYVVGKIDIGVHKELSLVQEDVCFNLLITNESVSFLANSKEQVFVEKLKSLLRLSVFTTRFKDIYDMYYLIPYLDRDKLQKAIYVLIYQDTTMKERNMKDITNRVKKTFGDDSFISNIASSKKNWVNVPNDKVLKTIVQFLSN